MLFCSSPESNRHMVFSITLCLLSVHLSEVNYLKKNLL